MDEYIAKIKDISAAMWKIFKNQLPVKTDNAYWDAVVDNFTEASKHYTGTRYEKYAEQMAILYMDELNRLYRYEQEDKK